MSWLRSAPGFFGPRASHRHRDGAKPGESVAMDRLEPMVTMSCWPAAGRPVYSRRMYRRFVRRQIRRAYGLISSGQLDELVAQFAPDALFSFPGDHELGGEFRGPAAVRTWFAEVRRLFPDFRLEPKRI